MTIPPTRELRIASSLEPIPQPAWDRLLGPTPAPFLSYEWLNALERTGCVVDREGWLAQHITLWEGDELIAAMPTYLKGSSEGEFVFDQSWAQAAQRMDLAYYPKLIVAVPFTPATGPRLLIRADQPRELCARQLLHGLQSHLEHLGISGAHVLFHRQDEAALCAASGLELRLGVQLHWRNPGYKNYDEFLATFDSARRNKLKRERREVQKSGIQTRTWRGREITEEVLDQMFGFYLASVEKFYPWTRQYLTRAFFERVLERMPEPIEIVIASDAGRAIAGAFNVCDGRRLYGRYWGASDYRPFLHFHVCYYHSIEACIERGIEVFEPGAGGGHKAPRGFEPNATYSSHRLSNPILSAAVNSFVQRERLAIRRSGVYEETPPEGSVEGC